MIGDLSAFTVESMRHANEVTITARRWGTTYIFRTCDEGWHVTKMRGGRVLNEDFIGYLPTEVREKVRPTHRHRPQRTERATAA